MKILSKILSRTEWFRINKCFNPILTLWINFRWLPYKQAIKFPISIYGRCKFAGNGKCRILGSISKGMIKINKLYPWAPGIMCNNTTIINDGTINFDGKCIIGTGNKIAIHKNGTIKLGDESRILDNVSIGCMNKIEIGKFTQITHRCQLYDSNYHFILNLNTLEIHNNKHSIIIGDYCWIGNTSTINGDVRIPNGTIVCSNSLVNKDFSDINDFSIIGGIPAKYIKSGQRRIFNAETELEIISFYKKNPHRIYTLDNPKSNNSNDLI